MPYHIYYIRKEYTKETGYNFYGWSYYAQVLIDDVWLDLVGQRTFQSFETAYRLLEKRYGSDVANRLSMRGY